MASEGLPPAAAVPRVLNRTTLPAAAGPNPLTYMLGALVGCTDYTAAMVAKERGLALR